MRRRLEKRLLRQEATLTRHSVARIAAFSLIPLGIFLPGQLEPASPILWTTLAMAGGLAVFALSVLAYERRRAARDRTGRHLTSVADLLLRLEGDWPDRAPDRSRQESPDHPYVGDLQVLGRGSLLQLLDRCGTARGTACLQRLLTEDPARPEVVEERLGAQAELAKLFVFRARFARVSRSNPTEPDATDAERDAFLAAAPVPALRAFLLCARVLPALTLVGYGTFAMGLSEAVYLVTLPLQVAVFLLFQMLTRASQKRAVDQTDSLESLEAILSVSRRLEPQSALLRRMNIFLGSTAYPTVRSLSRTTGLLGLRRNPLAHGLLGVFLLYDIHLMARIERLRAVARASLEDWFSDMAMLDALVAIADFSASRPNYCQPELVPEGTLVEADNLRHPFLPPETSVGNAVTLGIDRPLLLVSGSNMSGKSTLLRSIGLCLLLARIGARVPADRFLFSMLRLYSSIQVQDDLLRSTSLFYAEVRRIKTILDAVASGTVLFLLDEILRGTNERERHIAVRSIVRTLASSGSLGLVATHDVRLLEESCPAPGVRCVHFQETVSADGRMSFDYSLREGPVVGSNALRLLRHEGIAIDEE